MTVEHKEIMYFEHQDLVNFTHWKDKNDLSLRWIAHEIGISCSYLCDMLKGSRCVNDKFKNYLQKNDLIHIEKDKAFVSF